MLTRLWVRACLLCMLLLLVRPNAFAQPEDGTTEILTGTVTDTDGLAVPNALVSVIAASQNFTSFADSDDSGIYSVPDLPPGTYRIRIQADGFRDAVIYPVLVSEGDRKTFDIHLKSGPVQSFQMAEWKGLEQRKEQRVDLPLPENPSSAQILTRSLNRSIAIQPDAPPTVAERLIAYDPLLEHHPFKLEPQLPHLSSMPPNSDPIHRHQTSIEEHLHWKSAEQLALTEFDRHHPFAMALRSSSSARAVTRNELPEVVAASRTLNVPAFADQSKPALAVGKGSTPSLGGPTEVVAVQHSSTEKHNWQWARTTLTYFGKLGARLHKV